MLLLSNREFAGEIFSVPALQEKPPAREAGSGAMQNYGDILAIAWGTDDNGRHFLRSVAAFLLAGKFGWPGRKPAMCDGKSNDVALKARSGNSDGGDRTAAQRRESRDLATGSASTNSPERWFNEQLSQLYGEMLCEPLPEELVGLLEQIRRGKKSVTQKTI